MRKRMVRVLLLTASLAVLAGCSNEGSSTNRRTLVGAGATFPAPLYEKWIAAFGKEHPTSRITFQALGSGPGIEMFKEGKVDFVASDVDRVPTNKQLKEMPAGTQMFPVAAGSVVVCCNVAEVTAELKLSRAALAGIFLGNITSWNDPKIAETNKNVTLPNTKIVIVHRSGASGTTFVFTQHLSAISPDWKKGVGAGFTVAWPKGGKRGMGNDGVAEIIKDTPGAIGYLSFNVGVTSKLPMVSLENRAGEFVAPTLQSGKSALVSAILAANLRDWIPDAEGKGAYPIVTFTWILARKSYDDQNAAALLKEFLKYGLTIGQETSEPLGYIPLPPNLADKVLQQVERMGS